MITSPPNPHADEAAASLREYFAQVKAADPPVLSFLSGAVRVTPIDPGDMQFVAMVKAWQSGRCDPLLTDIVYLVRGIEGSYQHQWEGWNP